MVSRREFLRRIGVGIAGVTLLPLVPGCARNLVEPIARPGSFPFLTPTKDFFVQNGAQASTAGWQMPDPSPSLWSLGVDGLVATPKHFSLEDLTALATGHEMTLLKTLQCVFDAPLLSSVTGLTGNATWTGLPLQRVLDQCGVDTARAARIRFHGADGFGNNLKLDRVYGAPQPGLPPPMLATRMNGELLTREHGRPVRLIVAETFGYKNVKWLTRIELVSEDTPFGTYQDNGFFDAGTLGVNSRFVDPLNQAAIGAGQVEVSGFAVSGVSPLERVELRVDGGGWQAAEIVPLAEMALEEGFDLHALEQDKMGLAFPYGGVWCRWRFPWNATPGIHVLDVRARDQAGTEQPAVDAEMSDGTNGIMQVQVRVG